jgi:hypothetical protein
MKTKLHFKTVNSAYTCDVIGLHVMKEDLSGVHYADLL